MVMFPKGAKLALDPLNFRVTGGIIAVSVRFLKHYGNFASLRMLVKQNIV